MTDSPPSPTVAPADGRLGVLCVGLGAVTTTLIAGVELTKRGDEVPVGSLTQLGTIRIGKRTEDNVPRIKDFVPLANLDQMVFGAWDPYPDDAYTAASRAGVLDQGRHLEGIGDALRAIRPMPAAFDSNYVKRLEGTNVMAGTSKREMLNQIRVDINTFKDENICDRLVMIWCGSTEIYIEIGPAHADLDAFEAAIDAEDPSIAPSMLYAYAALQEGVPFANGAPNLAVDTPVLRKYAEQHGVPICGKDFKTKEVSKLGVLDDILEPKRFPELYGDVYHKVLINYYPPRGDNKEGWDNIDLFGWMGYPMQMKVDFLCRDSILAAPLALDLVLFMDLAQRAGMSGIQEWLSFYFKSPQCPPGLYPEHDLFIQQTKLKNTLRWMMGETPITHLGQDYDV